ncbi:MAG: alpha/beta hydrolase-fold protein [candidate division Zixibacteria bacterium]
MKKLTILLLIAALLPALIQCSKRDNPLDPTDVPRGLYWSLAFDSDAISGDIMLSNPGRDVMVYTPPGYPRYESITPGDTTVYGDPNDPDSLDIVLPDTTFIDYPVLYLLHGYGGDHTYFKGLFGLAATVDELVNFGQIEPMIVVTPDASNKLGGSFYTNSYSPDSSQSFAGLFQDYITNEVVPLIDSTFHTIADRQSRGIAGHSMGGYGAVKIGMLRNDLFGSVASMSGPLAFMGAYPDESNPLALGLLTLMQAMLAENGFIAGDISSFYSVAPGTGKDLTNMMFAMGAAFTPHDPADPDTTYAHAFTVPGFAGHVDLPFDVNGVLANSVWALWMAHDVTTLFSAGYGVVFDNTDLYIDCGEQDDLLLQYQALAFADAAGAAINQFEIYSGFEDIFNPDHSTFVAERLKEVIRFHDDSFNQ